MIIILSSVLMQRNVLALGDRNDTGDEA